MKPFAYLPVQWAFVLWRELNTLFVVLSILLAVIHLRAAPRMPVFVLALAGALASFPFQEAMFLGQVGGLVLLLWTVGVWAADSKRPILSAFCFALGTMVKVTPLLVVPLFILRKQWKWLIAYTSWMALFLGVGIWQLGWANHVTYFSKVLPAMSSGFPNSRNKSLFTIIQSLYFGDAFYQLDSSAVAIPFGLTLLGKALSLALFCGVLIYFYKQSKAATRIAHEITTLAVLSLLISPVTWRHHYVLIILPLLYLWLDAKRVALSDRSYVVLFLSTVAVASIFPFYLLELVHNSVLQIVVSAVMPAGAVALLAMSLVQDSRSTPMVDAEESRPEMRRPAEAGALMAAR
jgi:Gpi18-like mannosyltransferase